jgi:hypothetical protein
VGYLHVAATVKPFWVSAIREVSDEELHDLYSSTNVNTNKTNSVV